MEGDVRGQMKQVEEEKEGREGEEEGRKVGKRKKQVDEQGYEGSKVEKETNGGRRRKGEKGREREGS